MFNPHSGAFNDAGMTSGRAAQDAASRRRLTAWVVREIMPNEPAVRGWLRQRGQSPEDIDDLIQEAYAKLAGVTAPEQIAVPAGYFFQIVRNLMIDNLRRSRVVRIDAVGTAGDYLGPSDELTPERIASVRSELAQVLRSIEDLPERCREIFKLRRIEGLSQREIAARMGISESIVENDAGKGLAMLVQATNALLRAEEKKSS